MKPRFFRATSSGGSRSATAAASADLGCLGVYLNAVGGPAPLLHAKTDQAHGAACAWTDDYDASADPIPGCDTCKDQGASEPLLSCAYEPLPHVPATQASRPTRLGRGVAL